MQKLRERWMHFWFEPVGPENLGLCRVLFFGGFFLFYLPHDFSVWGEVSNAFWTPIWVFKKFHLPVLSSSTLAILQGFWKVTLALSCVGLFTRFSTAFAFILGAYLLGLPHNFGKVHHFDAFVVIILGIMALSRCGYSWSIDQVFGRIRQRSYSSAGRLRISGEYTWPVRAVWVTLSLVFFAAGIAKIRASGLEWIFSDNLAILLIQHHYRIAHLDPLVPWGLNLAQYGWLCRLFAAATILSEVGYPLALFSRRARWIIVPAVIFIVVGIRVTLGPSFYQYIICQIFWIPWDRVGQRLAGWSCRGRPEKSSVARQQGAAG